MMAALVTAGEKRLSELLAGVVPVDVDDDRLISGLAMDSREVVPGDLFFARGGKRTRGDEYIDSAVKAGAVAVIAEAREGVPRAHIGQVSAFGSVPVVSVADVPGCIGVVADRYFGHPSHALRLVGVTGTNGKTSVSHHIAEVLNGCRLAENDEVPVIHPVPGAGPKGGHRASRFVEGRSSSIPPRRYGLPGGDDPSGALCGLIGTLGCGLYGEMHPAVCTTPDAIAIQRELAEMHRRGARYAVMEVSSHGLDQGRVAGANFDTAVFTNLSRDHLDYHQDMAAYGAAKRRLFHTPGLCHAVINADDPFGRTLLEGLPAGVEAIAYQLDLPAPDGVAVRSNWDTTISGRLVKATYTGLVLAVRTPWGEGELSTPVFGRFNASNLLAALSALLAMGMSLETALERMATLSPPPGRMQRFEGRSGAPLVVVDYAHTPAALNIVLQSLREQCRGTLWCVLGCGGDRDRGKRPLMGAVAAQEADVVVLTDDNPRYEDGQEIIRDMLEGIAERSGIVIERDRGAAVRQAVLSASRDDVVLVAGKGHETYQEIQGKRRPFSDVAVVQAALRERVPIKEGET